MSMAQRLQQLEQAHEERLINKEAERLAKELDTDPKEVLRDCYGIAASMARWGLDDGVVHYLMEELGMSEDEARAYYEAARDEQERGR